jgi:hypothetical protein
MDFVHSEFTDNGKKKLLHWKSNSTTIDICLSALLCQSPLDGNDYIPAFQWLPTEWIAPGKNMKMFLPMLR